MQFHLAPCSLSVSPRLRYYRALVRHCYQSSKLLIFNEPQYLLFAFVAGAVVARDANGNIDLFRNLSYSGDADYAVGGIMNCHINNATSCPYGTHNYMQVMELV